MDVVFVSVPLISPEPMVAIPVTRTKLSLDQPNVVPPTAPVSAIVVIGVPEQTVWLLGVATALGVGLTVTDIGEEAAELQPDTVTITV